MRFCTNCGREVADGQRFCTACGQDMFADAPVQRPRAAAQQVRQPEAPYPGPAVYDDGWDQLPPHVPKKRSNLPLIILVAVLALLLAGLAVWFFLLRDKGDDDASGEAQQTEQTEQEPAVSFAPDTPIAADVTFDHTWDGGGEYAVISGTDATGKVLWKVETPRFGTAQLARVTGMAIRNNVYYYVEDGDVVALSLADGSEVWRNSDFKGSACEHGWAFDANGSVYVSGYEGPDLIVISPQGKTLYRYAEFHSDYYWPYKVQALDNGGALITYEMGPGESEGTLTVNVQTGEVLGAEGAGSDAPAAGNAGVTVTASSTLQEKGYDHSPRLVMDGSTATSWVEGGSGNGPTEWLRLDFGGARTLSTINIWNGYQKTETLFYKNCRPAIIRIAFSDGSKFETTLADQMGMQSIPLSSPVTTSYVMITIVSVYAGSTYADACISEISLA